MADDVTKYLQEQTHKAQRTFRVASISMSVVLIVVFGYFQWLKSELADILAPASIAEAMVNQARAALPQVGDALEANVQSEAPSLVRFALHQAVDHVLPLLGQMFATTLDDHAREVGRIAATSSDQAFDTVLGQLAAERGKGPKKPVTGVQLASFLGAHFPAALWALTEDEIGKRLDEAGGTLKHIDARLATMAGGDRGSRKGELGHRLISTWWTFLDRGRPSHEPADAEREPGGAKR